MSSSTLRRMFLVSLLLIVLPGAGDALGELVTIHGSGVITEWYTYPLSGDPYAGAPPALMTAFPIGAPFDVTGTYDSTGYTETFQTFPTSRYFRGPFEFTNIDGLVAGHNVSRATTATFSSVAQVLVFNENLPSGDQILLDVFADVDGLKFFAGYEVRYAAVGVRGLDLTEIVNVDLLPSSICFGEWESIGFSLNFLDPVSRDLYVMLGRAIPDRTLDSDADGIDDGTERLFSCIDPCAGDTDSDADTLSDSVELTLGTNPCNGDTDGDGIGDAVDPDPLVPGPSLEEAADEIAEAVLATPEAAFTGPNANAQRGRRNALANRLEAVADTLEAGDLEEALSMLRNILRQLDGDPSPPDVMADGPEKDALRAAIEALIADIEAALA